MMNVTRRVLLSALVLGFVHTAIGQARASLVTSRAALNATDVINWAQLGTPGTSIANPVNVTSTGGATGVASQLSGNGVREDQRNGWSGNFAVGDALYWTQTGNIGNDRGPITLTFDAPVSGVGTQIQSDLFGSFTATIQTFDSLGNALSSYTEDGFSNSNRDNSAIFIGVLDGTADVSKVVFGLSAATNGTTPDFAINQVSLTSSTRAVPEPATIASLGFGLIAGAGALLRRRKAQVAA